MDKRSKIILERKNNIFRAVKCSIDPASGSYRADDFSLSVCSDMNDPETVKRSLAVIIDSTGYEGEPVTLVIDSSDVVYRYVKFPSVKSSELKGMVKHYIKNIAPFNPQDILSGYDTVAQDDDYSYVNIICAHRRCVDPVMAALDSLDVALEAVFTGCYALAARIADRTELRENEFLTVHIEPEKTGFLIVDNSKLCLARYLYSTDQEEIFRYINQTQSYYIKHSGRGPLSAVVVVYGDEKDSSKITFFKSRLPFPVSAVPEKSLITVKNNTFAGNMASMLAFCDKNVGDSLNLLPVEMQEKKIFSKKFRDRVIMLVSLLAFMSVLCGFSALRTLRYQQEHDRRLSELTLAAEKTGGLLEKKADLESLAASREQIRFIMDFFYLIHASLPSGISAQNISCPTGKEKVFLLQGYAQESEQVFLYVETMRGMGIFDPENIKVNYVTSRQAGGRERVEFEIVFVR